MWNPGQLRLIFAGDFSSPPVNMECLEADKDDVTNSEKVLEITFNSSQALLK